MVKNSRIAYFLIALAFLSLSLASASARTLIAGKVYNADFSSTMERAGVRAVCDNNPATTLITQSLDDGTYAVRFEEISCKEGDSVVVYANKPGFQEKSGSGIVTNCTGADCPENYVVIVNLGLETAISSGGNSGGSSGGSSGGRYYFCGNGVCDSGENVNTCYKDCKNIELLTQSDTKTADENTGSNIVTLQSQSPSENGFFSRITGAVAGSIGNAGFLIVILFILGLVIMAIAVNFARRAKRKKRHEDIYLGSNTEVLKAGK